MHYDVVIAGGGFAGAYCARALGRILGQSAEKRIALIAERNVLVFHPMLAEVAGSALAPRDVAHPLREFCRHVDVLQGRILKVDWATRSLVLDGGRFTRNHRLTFQHLVMALGSVTDLSRVPGMTEYGWPMKSVADALRLRAALINRLEEANLVEDETIRARLMTFSIVGGGYTGVETAGQIADLLREAQPRYAHLRERKLRVVLLHSRPHLLEEIGPDLGDYAQRVLEKNGIEVKLNTRVAEVTATKVVFSDGGYLETNTVIATIGAAPNPVATDLAAQLQLATQNGRLVVEPTMRVTGQTELWALGDGAAVPWKDRGTDKLAPPTAQFALRQGEQLGRNLASLLRDPQAHLRPFTYRYQGQLATVGERQAVAEIWGYHFSGFIAWWMWRTIYLAKLPGALRRLRVMIDWTFDLVFQRDISVTQPPPDEPVRSIHLESGESLVERGDTVRGIYVLQKGQWLVQGPKYPPQLLVAPAVVDHRFAEGGIWSVSVSSDGGSDAVVLRTKALAVLERGWRLTRETDEQAMV